MEAIHASERVRAAAPYSGRRRESHLELGQDRAVLSKALAFVAPHHPGALDSERAHSLLGAIWQLLRSAELEAVCVVMAPMAVLHLVPISGLAGGHVRARPPLFGMRPEDRAGKIIGAVTAPGQGRTAR